MLNEFDVVKLKNGDAELGITPDIEGVIVDIATSLQGKKGYTIEFFGIEEDIVLKALMKHYTEDEIVKVTEE